ncbi:MAG: exonuclease subunit SbcD [Proteobacteria bacterium]|nr:exonuclease subunit SbcD [Pseudomonadota bacterium]
MRLLHTSDWHLGHNLLSKDRKSEHRQFLDWLIECLKDETIDVLIVAGDIFDTSMPSNYAFQLYYDFLRRISETPCHTVVIVGGNHDSVSTLHAPRELLRLFNVHVVGGIGDSLEDEIIVVKGRDGLPAGLICAVPFLRDRDVRQSVAGESYEEKSKAMLEGIKAHYHRVKEKALQMADGLSKDGRKLPLIATGHLFAAGGLISDGVREIYVGSLGQIQAASFPMEFDYVALGHLHKPQTVGGKENVRYSGSPIPLSFSEAGSEKKVIVVEFDGDSTSMKTRSLPIPEFQELRLIKGDLERIEERLRSTRPSEDGGTVWVEVQLDTDEWIPDLQNKINELVEDLPMEVLIVKNLRSDGPDGLRRTKKQETLQELTPLDVFRKRLQAEEGLDEEEEKNLLLAFNEIINRVDQREIGETR